jgi:hypothetical protein
MHSNNSRLIYIKTLKLLAIILCNVYGNISVIRSDQSDSVVAVKIF